MGYPYAAGEEHYGTVGIQDLTAAVWSFDEGGDGGAAVGGEGFCEELFCEATASTHYQGYGSLWESEDVGCWGYGVCVAFLGVGVPVGLGDGFGPGDGEGVGGPEAD